MSDDTDRPTLTLSKGELASVRNHHAAVLAALWDERDLQTTSALMRARLDDAIRHERIVLAALGLLRIQQ